jgi:hypothetical protein
MDTKERIKPFIIQCIIMRLSEKESLSYLNQRGFNISIQYFYKLKKQIQESRFDRLNLIAKSQFIDQHLERIDQLELINSELWSLYRQEKNIFKKAQILEKIAEFQTYISPYYEASRWIMEQSVQESNKENKDNNEKRKKRSISDT